MRKIPKPEAGEYPPYALMYIGLLPDDGLVLPGFEQDDYARYSGANARSRTDILQEYAAVRNATITLFNGLAEEALTRAGVANKNLVSVRALGYHIAGHELHHMQLIKERYL